MKNKAQITPYIILGIILVIIISLFFLFKPTILEPEEIIEIPFELQPLKNHIDDCLEQTSVNALVLLGIQGGHIVPKEKDLKTPYANITYGYYQGINVFPTLTQIEKELSKTIDNSFKNCLDFSLFNNFEITTESIETKTKVNLNKVVFEVNYPISAKLGDSETNLNKFIYTAPIRLGYIHNALQSIIKTTKKDPEWIDMTLLSDFNLDIDITPHNKNTFIYSISDKSSLISGEPYLFLSANSFYIDQPPTLQIPDVIRLKQGIANLTQLIATDPENNPLTFSDDSPLFDISEDGIILFVPEVPGEFDVIISVEDTHENKVSKIVKFIIE
jgi:hypothetical protein